MKFLLTHGAAALFLDPGLGKTSIVLFALRYLFNAGTARRALVVAPLRVCWLVWPKEVQKWAQLSGLRVEVLHGPKKQEALERDADIYLINPEGLDWLAKEDRFKKLGADTLVVDESRKFKNHRSQRFKALSKWLPSFQRRWILTGSPATNGLMDLFGQVYILDMGRALGRYVTKFRSEFFDQFGFDYKIKPDGEARINKALKPLALRLSAEDYLDLPELIFQDIWVDLPPDARRLYTEMETLMFAELTEGGESFAAVNSGVASMKCRQIISGALYREGHAAHKGEEYVTIHDAKVEALNDLVEELEGQPILIAYEFRHDLHRLQKLFGKDVPVIGAGTSTKRTAEIERAWNAGELPILLGHPASMGHGLNLQGSGKHVGWFGVTWDLDLYEQFIRRVYRQGNKHGTVYVHRIVARNTLDLAVLRALSAKDRTQQAFLSALNTYRKRADSIAWWRRAL